MDPQALVVADDRTGAADTGNRLAARGYATAVVGRSSAPDGATDAAVVARDLDSRYVASDEAARRVRAAVGGTDALVYKKVDSTLRGNVAAEAVAALEASGAALALAAPAFPANGRTTVGGYHLVDGTPVADTPAGADPDAPVRTSSLPALLDGAGAPVAGVGIETVAAGPEAIRDRLRTVCEDSDDPPLLACDAARDAHLDALAAGAAALDASVCYVGSAGLAGHVRLDEDGGVLGVVGSVAPETLAQLDALPEDVVVELDAAGLFSTGAEGDPVAAAAAAAGERLAAGERAVVTAAREEADVRDALAAGQAAGLEAGAVRERVADALAAVAARAGSDARAFFLSGGAVAAAALDALGAAVALTGHAVTDGVPIGRTRGGPTAGAPVVTKAGAFGDDETILTCLGALARYDDGR
jgi:uncharacterized protein YgbK (DUF1537 family)